jgi:DhnA family fructose-bisphosphate aldolase class Ia
MRRLRDGRPPQAVCGQLGAHVVKTYCCGEGFETAAWACPVALAMASGKKPVNRFLPRIKREVMT